MTSHPAFRIGRGLALLLGVLALGVTVALVVLEDVWDENNHPPADEIRAFVEGTLGTELAPEVVMAVLPDIFPDAFRPVDVYLAAQQVEQPSAGDWIDQYGFVRRTIAPEPNDRSPFPVGFVRSYHRPGGGAASPVPFIALSCAACHSAEIRTEVDKPGVVFYGVGNPAMNLLAFSEAFRGLLMKRVKSTDPDPPYELTVDRVANEWKEKGRALTPAEKLMTWAWLQAARADIGDYQRVIDDPYRPEQLFDPRFLLAGPARTQPFRSLVRVHLDRPGMWNLGYQLDQGFSKIPVVFHQDPEYHGKWAQFDGSVDDITARSTLAASTAGGNVQNLSRPDIAQTIIKAADFTRKLPSPAWADAFGTKYPIDEKRAAAGKKVYAEHCRRCHGEPLVEPGGKRLWTWTDDGNRGPKFGDVIPLDEIKTDPDRVTFRHRDAVPDRVADEFGKNFRKKHPLATFTKDNFRTEDGYLAGPISGTFLRAPYLHNASVLTLTELIGLEPRRDFFYRGRNAYDTEKVGYHSPAVPLDEKTHLPVSTKPADRHYYFFFDTRVRGNSNKGHEYPKWAFDPAKRPTEDQKSQLIALREYLKTL